MGALFLKNATLTIDGKDSSDDVDNVLFTPTTATSSFMPISGNAQQEQGATTWVATFNIAQNYEAGSLFMRLLEDSEEMAAEFKPRGAATGPTIKARLMPAPAAIGGGIGALTASATLAVNGKPEVTGTAAPAAAAAAAADTDFPSGY